MTDEIVQYASRYQFVPVAGTTDQYDLVRVRGTVTAEGSNLNKANILPDATCTALGISTASEPKDALTALHTLANSKAKIVTGSYTGTGTCGDANPNALTLPANAKTISIWSIVSSTGIYRVVDIPVYLLTASYKDAHDWWTGSSGYSNKMKLVGTTLSWYGNSAANQLNNSNETYYYLITV